MDISQRRNIPQSIYNFVKVLKYDSLPIILQGTAGLASQQYYSDFDLFTQIEKKQTAEQAFKKITDIINKMDSFNDAYFIEFKIQTKKGDKQKYNHIDEINKQEFDKLFQDIDYIKLDFVIRIENKFIELSIIYSFNNKLFDNKEFLFKISNDVNELKKEGNYFKALKRIFAIYNNKRVRDKLEKTNRYIFLSKFFNTDYGKLYSETSNLKAIKLLLEHYDDEETIKRALLNLKDLHIEPDLNKLDAHIKENEKRYNTEAKKILNKLNKI